MAKTKAKSKSKKTTKAKKEYPTYQELEGKAVKITDPEDNEVKEGTVIELGEHDKNGTPHTAVVQLRRAVTRLVVDPKDIERLEGNGFEGGY